MTYGIIGALDEEVELLTAALTDKRSAVFGPYAFAAGVLEGKECVICRSGIGKVAAANCALAMIAEFKVTALINTGAAGGIAPGMQVGDLALSTAAVQHDFDLTVFGYQPGQLAGHDPQLKADDKLLAAARTAAKAAGFAQPYEGLILSGDQFVSSDDKVKQLLKTFPGSVAVEMEGAAIAQTAVDFKVPFLVVRAISDCADNHGAVSYDTFSKEVSAKSAAFVRALIKAL